MAHKIKHKPKRKKDIQNQNVTTTEVVEEIEYSDQFTESVGKALNKTMEYKYIVIAAILISLIGAGVFSYLRKSKEQEKMSVSNQFTEAMEIYQKPVVSVDTDEKLETVFKTSEQKYKVALSNFQAYSTKYPEKPLGIVAILYEANSYFQLKQYNDALKSYKIFIQKTDNVDLKELAILKVAQIYKDQKRYKEANEWFDKILNSKNNYVAAAALFSQGEIFELKNNSAKARQKFEQITKNYKDSFFSYKAQQKLSKIN